MFNTRRRVVTAHQKGRAIVASDVEIPMDSVPGMKGWKICDVWADADMQLPDTGERPEVSWYFPPVGGFRVIQVVMEPHTVAGHDAAEAEAANEGKPSALANMTDKPGMHRSDSIDVGFIVQGSVVCELDDGETVTLHAGDTFIQGGTMHAWSNPFDEPCYMTAVSIGAKRIEA